MKAQELIDEVSIEILADKDYDFFRWEELKNKIAEEDGLK